MWRAVPVSTKDVKRRLRKQLISIEDAIDRARRETADEVFRASNRKILNGEGPIRDDTYSCAESDKDVEESRFDEPYYVDGCPVYGVDDEEDAEITYWNTH